MGNLEKTDRQSVHREYTDSQSSDSHDSHAAFAALKSSSFLEKILFGCGCADIMAAGGVSPWLVVLNQLRARLVPGQEGAGWVHPDRSWELRGDNGGSQAADRLSPPNYDTLHIY